MLDTARLGTPRRDVVRGTGWSGHARGVEAHMEQRYHAVMEVIPGAPLTEVARRYGVSRRAVHGRQTGMREKGLAGLVDHSHRPVYQPRHLDATCPDMLAGRKLSERFGR